MYDMHARRWCLIRFQTSRLQRGLQTWLPQIRSAGSIQMPREASAEAETVDKWVLRGIPAFFAQRVRRRETKRSISVCGIVWSHRSACTPAAAASRPGETVTRRQPNRTASASTYRAHVVGTPRHGTTTGAHGDRSVNISSYHSQEREEREGARTHTRNTHIHTHST